MSRIADVLRKAREQNGTPARHADPRGPAPRSMSDVTVPWSLRGEPAVEMELALHEPLRSREPAADHLLGAPTPMPVHPPAAVPSTPPTAPRGVDRPAIDVGNQSIASLVRELFLAG